MSSAVRSRVIVVPIIVHADGRILLCRMAPGRGVFPRVTLQIFCASANRQLQALLYDPRNPDVGVPLELKTLDFRIQSGTPPSSR